jgi:immune inhibitor A
MKRGTLIAILIGLVVTTVCVCLALTGALAVFLSNSQDWIANGFEPGQPAAGAAPAPQPTTDPRVAIGDAPTAQPGPTVGSQTNTPEPTTRQPSPQPTRIEVEASAQGNLDALLESTLPREDLISLAVRFKSVPPDKTTVVCAGEANYYNLGDTRQFLLSNQDTDTQFTIDAELAARTEHTYAWVEVRPRAVNLDRDRLRRAMEQFERDIYPRSRDFFGSEASPGVDCDKHIHVVHAAGIGSSVGGYFAKTDGLPRNVRSDSNVGEIYVMHASRGYNGARPGTASYMSTLAHEFQHMIAANVTHAPDLWLEEGAAQFNERLNGYAREIGTVNSFAALPESQLNAWSETSAGENSATYGGGYLFWSYLYDRFGEDMLRRLARSPERSEQAFMGVLADNGVVNPDTNQAYTFEELFADFVIANFQSRSRIADAGDRYNYTSIRVPTMANRARYDSSNFPLDVQDRLAQFGTHYIRLNSTQPIDIDFAGLDTVQVFPAESSDGTFWYSNRGDVSNPRLTREVDLSGLSTATLRFRAWYRLEQSYDYGYISVSADNGATWRTLTSSTCTTENPQNANLGCGWSGPSGAAGAEQPLWIDEQVDLSTYAGRKILIRFETVSDAGVHRDGLAIDNLEIPELGWRDDASSDSDWRAEGWVRISNMLPQRWSVQLILVRSDGSRALIRPTQDGARVRTRVDLGGEVTSAILVISPVTQITTEQAEYRLRIQ